MAFSSVLNDAEVKKALEGCSGEPHHLHSYAVNYTVNALDSSFFVYYDFYYWKRGPKLKKKKPQQQLVQMEVTALRPHAVMCKQPVGS